MQGAPIVKHQDLPVSFAQIWNISLPFNCYPLKTCFFSLLCTDSERTKQKKNHKQVIKHHIQCLPEYQNVSSLCPLLCQNFMWNRNWTDLKDHTPRLDISLLPLCLHPLLQRDRRFDVNEEVGSASSSLMFLFHLGSEGLSVTPLEIWLPSVPWRLLIFPQEKRLCAG